ncbi:MAG: DNA polymerase III subunit gamma and tau, partial [Hamadaea sp.]|nr:DNA polymerase III subunit gamma and tau [Hamadaea sp.]
MALALYRKYRPRTFAEVIGQEHVTEPLIQALSSGRLNHAYLFSGPRGCGKTSSARILARSLNCEKGPTPEPCGECESCRALAPDGPGSIDVIEIDAASHGGVDDARELRERAFFAPAVSRFKIYIIDEAHMVSSAGFNALLKLVEEPPEYVKFVFATTEPEKVLGTIKSRTHHYPFRLMPPGVLRPYLEKLCDLEGVTVDPLVLPLVVRAGGGSARDSLSVLDQLIAGAGPEGVTYARAVALLGVTDATLIDDVCDALAAGDAAAAFGAIDRVAEAGHDPRRFTADLLERLRDLILLRQIPDAAAKGLIDAPADQLDRMQAQAQRLGPATLSRWAEIAHNGLVEMRGTTSTRLLLELITARMLLPTVDASEVGLLSRIERLEQGVPSVGSAGSAAASTGSASVSDGDGRAAARSAAPASSAQAAPTQAAPTQAGPAQAGPGAAAAPMSSAPAPATEPEAARPASAPPADRPVSAPADPAAGVQKGAPVDRPVSAPATPGAAPVSASASPAGGSESAPVDRPVSAPASPAAGVPESAPASGEIDAPALRRAWDEIVQLTGRSNKRTAAMARDGVVRDVEGTTIVLVFKASFHANSVSADPGALLDAIHEVVGGRWQLRCEVGGDQRGGGGSVSRTASRPAQPTRPAASPREPRSAPPADAEDWPATAPIGGNSGGGSGGDVPVSAAGPSASAPVRSRPLAQAPAAQTVSAGGRAATATAVVDEDF